MSWTWRYEDSNGTPLTGVGSVESFPTQGDAETWVGETWRELLDQGVEQVSLLEDGREVYGPMSLRVS
jgi:hypothetical protein